MKRTGRWLAMLLSAVLLLGLLPAAALAAEMDWARPAVNALNEIYEDGAFSADDDTMTLSDASTFFEAVGYTSNETSGNLTRGKAAEILTGIYDIPVPEGKTAIQYLYEQNIVNGRGPDNLAEDEDVTKAEFAVLAYRVLNSVGGGLGSSVEGLIPGSKEYFSWMYLAARRCISPDVGTTDTFTKETWTGEDDSESSDDQGEEQPKGWKGLLEASGVSNELLQDAEQAVINEDDDEQQTILEAAVAVVDALGVDQIFTDVQPGVYFYDGVMYLFDHGIVTGYGDGSFKPNDNIIRGHFAVLLYRAFGKDDDTSGTGEAEAAFSFMNDNGYADWTSDTANEPVTREDAATAILKACVTNDEITLSENNNTAILDRFADGNSVSEANRAYLAYALSHGIMNGVNPTTLDPTGNVTRGQAGVLLYRTLLGADRTKMKDYEDSVKYAMEDGGEEENRAEGLAQTLSLVSPLADDGGDPSKTLTLREDWRLTSDLNLAVPEGTDLIVDGGGRYIYEMGGKLSNSGGGSVHFTDGTVVYPQSGTTVSLTAFQNKSKTPTVTVPQTISADSTVSISPIDGYDFQVTASSNTAVIDLDGKITQPASDTTVTLTLTLHDSANNFYAGQWTVPVTVPGRGGGTSSSTPSTPSTPSQSVTVPVSDGKSSINVSATVSGTTATVSQIDTSKLENMDGGEEKATVEIDFSGLNTTVNTVNLPAAAVSEIAAAAQASENGVTGLSVKLSSGEITFDANALSAIQAQAGTQISLSVVPAKDSDLNASQRETVGDAPVFDLSLRSGGKAITDFRGGHATVSIPHTLETGQEPAGVVVYYLDAGGNVEKCDTVYDLRAQTVTFTTGHLSLYFVAYDETAVAAPWENPFTDVDESAWYYDAARFVSENNLMTGYGNSQFGPDDNLSRAQLAQILFNKEGLPAVTVSGVFTDVADGAWYANAVNWASANSIVAGYGGGLFGPNDNITREQLAVMLWRYAGKPASASRELTFTDADDVSDYALEALYWAVENGVVSGYNGRLEPKSSASRCQVAQMLKNYLDK